MDETALVVPVGDADALVAGHRLRYDAAVAVGVPAAAWRLCGVDIR